MTAFVILCLFAFLGSFISQLFHLPIPGSVLGAIIFFIYTIAVGGFKEKFVQQAQYILMYMALWILPLCIKIVDTYQQFLHNAIGILVTLVISTICGSIVTAIIFNIFLKRERKKILHKLLYQTIRKKKNNLVKK